MRRFVVAAAVAALAVSGMAGSAAPAYAMNTTGDFYALGTGYCASTYTKPDGSPHPTISGFGPAADINADDGDLERAVYAPADGDVVARTEMPNTTGWGNSIIWTSVDGRERLHVAHLNQIVRTGPVRGGDLIAKAGNTGSVSSKGTAPDYGAHLHLARSLDGQPAPLVLSGRTIVAGSATNRPCGSSHYVSAGQATTYLSWSMRRLTSDEVSSAAALAISPTGATHIVAERSDGGVRSLDHLSYQVDEWVAARITDDGSDPSMAIDADRKVHVAFRRWGVGVYYATNASGTWVTTRISANADDGGPSLVLDAAGKAHVAYTRGGSSQGVVYATNESGAWTTRGLTTSDDSDPSIALDGSGAVHVVFGRWSANPGIFHATNNSGTWVTSRVTSGGEDREPALAIDRGGRLHVAFVRDASDGIHYTTNKSGAWVIKQLSAAGDFSPSIALDGSGKVHVTYTRFYPTEGSYHATNASGSWATELLRANALGPSFGLDVNGKLRVALNDDGILLMNDKSGAWATARLSTSRDSYLPALALDSTGRVHVAVARAGAGRGLYYYSNRGGTWTETRISSRVMVDRVSLAVDGNGKAHLAISSETCQSCTWAFVPHPVTHYLTNTSGTWALATVSLGSEAPSIALDGAGHPFVAVSDGDKTEDPGVLVFSRTGATWAFRQWTVAEDEQPSLVLDGAGHGHVAFVRWGPTNPGIYYVTDATGSPLARRLTSNTADTAPAIAIDAAGRIHVVFAREGYGIYYLTNKSGSWPAAPTRISAGTADGAPSIDVDANGKVHVAYGRTEGVPGAYYVTNASGPWVTTRITTTDPYSDPDLAVDANGTVHVALDRQALGSGGIRYARY